jgi:transposase, IS30 family
MDERRRLNYGDRKIIENCLDTGWKLSDIADEVECDPTAVSREIKRNRMKLGQVAKSRFKIIRCQNFDTCEKRGICNPRCHRRCRSCDSRICEEECPDYVEFECHRSERFPHVCNGCKLMNRCPKDRMVYRARGANKRAALRASEPRRGLDLGREELAAIARTVAPLLAKGQSVKAILSSHPEIGVSSTTLYAYIDSGLIEGASNMVLPRKVKFKKRRRHRIAKSPRRDLTGRDYEAFCALPDAVRETCKEMDTVIGRLGGKCLLTFCLRDCSIFYAVLIESKHAEHVVSALDDLEMAVADNEVLGELGCLVVLTDNGGEFDRFEEMERSWYAPGSGEKRIEVYYCDSYCSWQKPHVENAHTLLRRVLPKGSSFDDLTQDDINLICSHVNSYPREELGWKSPFEVLPEWGQGNLPRTFGMTIIPRDEVNLSQGLIGR